MQFKKSQTEQLDVNVTPLIDVVFLLLIFFMVSTTFTKQTKLEIDLPSSQVEKITDLPPEKIIIEINATGEYAVNDEILSTNDEATLKSMIEAKASGKNDLPFIITADGKTPHQAVITAMDVARQLGFVKISFATKKSTEQK